ncbi:RsmB/NOP family class I SAM-dependent RNA methyltransferase [Hyperthermus butylicus]|uniref:tRNA and rRNA cytosine-C5-methylase n=1 Tax=Hyperthermus butylicus (strain DSM 5456 / JCM 9403 / PLM1-5) TaxID=415426 RepID=A2BN19_HYPBU|nr:RsmB/NOP family class I SAM-dependent RNA methyltransferase [Hyperthermus butylicus]ABM81380.1 putative tRNA and rRNA cytosine-C5-methylase [Hyperthermus butylicus DSM 5456]
MNIAAALRELKEAFHRLEEKYGDLAQSLVEKYHSVRLHRDQVVRYLELFDTVSEVERLLSTGEDKVMKTIRVNTLLADPEEVSERLEAKGFRLRRHPYIDYGLVVLEEPIPIGATHEYMLGLYTVQGPASMMVVPALDPPGKGRIADMCAGAGVKTTQIAQHSPQAHIVALDINRRKLLALKNNASRLAVFNIVALNMDARRLPQLGRFDAILLDAPCSGEGLLAFQRGRWPRSFNDIASRVELQLQLLKAGIEALADNGVLVYATCSISVEENEYVVTRILEEYSSLDLEEPPIKAGLPGKQSYAGLKLDRRVSRCRRFYPHIHGTEGFTICRLVKRKS